MEDERQMLLVQEEYHDYEVNVSERVGDRWTPFRALAHDVIDIRCWTFVGPNRLALFDFNACSTSVQIYEFGSSCALTVPHSLIS